MPKPREAAKPPISEMALTTTPTPRWSTSHGMYIAGRSYADGADETAAEMEGKWGAGRLRLLVPAEMRERFDRQRYLYNQALWHGQLEDVRRESGRMVKAWMALDRAAEAAGCPRRPSEVWECPLPDGTVLAIVPDASHEVQTDGREVRVWTIDEVARVIGEHVVVNAIKATWPGSKVEPIARSVPDPLDGIQDSVNPIDEMVPF